MLSKTADGHNTDPTTIAHTQALVGKGNGNNDGEGGRNGDGEGDSQSRPLISIFLAVLAPESAYDVVLKVRFEELVVVVPTLPHSRCVWALTLTLTLT